MRKHINELRRGSLGFAYFFVLLFYVLYFIRPEDFMAVSLPLEKIVGGMAAAAVAFAVLARPSRALNLPLNAVLTVVLFLHLLLTIPLAYWPGGSFDVVVNGFSKIAAIVVAASLTVTTLQRFKALLLVQSIHAPLIAVLALSANIEQNGRLKGFGNAFENPNDFALLLVIGIGLASGWILHTRSVAFKLFWATAIVVMAYAILRTYSRTGFLAMIATMLVAGWTLGIRSRRRSFVFFAIATLLLPIVMSPQNFGQRMATIINPAADATGSAQERQELLTTSLQVAVHNPILGIGPGNFTVVSGHWRVAHNSYAEMAAETGLPGFILFMALVVIAFKSANRARHCPELNVWSGSLIAAMAGLAVGCFFGSFSYAFLPYLMFSYAAAARQIQRASIIEVHKASEPAQPDIPYTDDVRTSLWSS